MGWPEFKKIIYDIFDHRIEYAAEINGAINTSYMSLDEHLLMYWTGTFLLTPAIKPKVEMHGTKEDIQLKMIEFLYSLKFYSKRWLRARMYARLAGFITEVPLGTSNVPVKYHQPHSSLLNACSDHNFKDVEIPLSDIYSQEFYFYAYSFITRDRKGFIESKEGNTYIRQQYE